MNYVLQLLDLVRQEPIAAGALLAIVFILVFYFVYERGAAYGRKQQHVQELDALCSPGEHVEKIVDSHGDTWSVLVKAILLRRGNRNV